MKKTMALMTTVALGAGLLAGCGANNNAEGGANGGNGGAADEKVTLSVWGMGEEAKTLPKLAEEFTKENPNITINVQALPWDQGHEKLLTAIASKKGPDVVQMGSSWIPEFADAGALADLAPYAEQYPELKQENFYAGAVEAGTYEDQYVSTPWYVETRVLYYRTDLLKEVGYDQAPQNWEELSDAAQKLAARGDGKYGISIDPKEQSLGFMFARQNGAEWFTADGQPDFASDKFVEAVEYINSFYQNGSAPKDLGLDIIPAFKEGILPMFISGPWMIKLIQDQAADIDGKWSMAVLPKKENNTSLLGGSNLSIFEYSKNKDAAAKFVAFMSKAETQLKWMEYTSSLPAATAAWEDDSLKNNDFYKVIGEQLNAAVPMPVITAWSQISQSYVKHFEVIYRNNADVKKELEAFNADAVKFMK
ncbi:sugar ABC transporter substrate-binding protein [Paenibacillus arenilitoris]|uniref:Sugar ABC transporter substrate-binding protein n=1 Tax=Paenibacillus arenilitoris TaxID=2772299 RepID=A0A927CT69_9BACL|nr:sugar ABC transporter substrate-binding protein [Paenibacillus arenilitoris]MBD2872468.1 sugar ABC transporter substrate-binding protein [Paenibacillus arenilitoris]